MRQAAVGFTSKKLMLEGVLATPQGIPEPFPALVVCHPHPMLSGNMENPVVTAICRAADRQGIASLRFNFRGVGGSEGEFSNGKGEQDDLKSALDVLRGWPGLDGKGLALVGYSFGASVVLGGLRRYGAASSLILIAPPISSVRDSRISKDRRPKLFVVGARDRIVSSLGLQRVLDEIRPPVQLAEISDADHTLGAHEEEVADRVVAFVASSLAG